MVLEIGDKITGTLKLQVVLLHMCTALSNLHTETV